MEETFHFGREKGQNPMSMLLKRGNVLRFARLERIKECDSDEKILKLFFMGDVLLLISFHAVWGDFR